MPCLLFTRVLPAIDYELMEFAWPLLLLPVAFVLIGLVLGRIVLLICQPKPELRATILCSVAFGNPLSMPLMLLTTIQDEMFDPDRRQALGSIADPVVYLSLVQPLA